MARYQGRFRALGLLSLACLGVLAAFPAAAQVPHVKNRPDYIRIPYKGDMEAFLKQMLGQVEGQHDLDAALQKWLKEAQADPSQFKLKLNQKDLEAWQKKITENPMALKHLPGLLDRPGLMGQIDPQKIAQWKETLEKLKPPELPEGPPGNPAQPPGQFPPGQGGPVPPGQVPPGQGGPVPPGQAPPPGTVQPTPPPLAPTDVPDAGPAGEDALTEWLRERLEGLENSDLKDMLLESDAFQKAITDLQSFTPPGNDTGLLGSHATEEVAKWLGQLPDVHWDLKLPHPDWHLGKIDVPSLPSVNMPAVPLPSMGPVGVAAPGAPAALALGPVLMAFVAVVLAGAVAWLVWKAAPWKTLRQGRQAGWQLGGWPVDPARVSTAAELILAFNYLSLRLFGPEARSWNHATVAGHIGQGGQSARQEAAARLAELYEHARYAPAAEPLAPEDLRQAREHLGALAADQP